jgi:hypothetical protein
VQRTIHERPPTAAVNTQPARRSQVRTETTTTAHQPWCDDKDDEEQRGHECNLGRSVDLSRYPPEPQRSGDWQPNGGALLSRHDGEDRPYVVLSISLGDGSAAADLTVAEAAQLAAALSLPAAKASTPQ